jgi:hypothetical protein
MEPRIVHCAEHGDAYATFVCAHLADGTGTGFFTAESPDERPHA